MILAVASFVMVLYSTFLTRSGILGDTSVHSFVDPGKFAFWILLLFMVTFVAIGITMVLRRRSDMNIHREEFAPTTREFMLSIGSALIMASAIFVTIGTSWPVIMEVLGLPKVAVAIEFYNRVHLVLVPAVLIVNALSLIFLWRSTPRAKMQSLIIFGAAIAAVATAVMAVIGINDVGQIVLAFTAWFSLAINLRVGISIMSASPAMAGAYISHTGIALLIFGVITTSSYTESHHAVLVHGVPTQVGEYTLTYLGKEQVEKHYADREKYKYFVRIERDGSGETVAAVLYWSDFNKRQSAFLEPGIRWGLHNDLYVSPKSTEREDLFKRTTIMRGTSIRAPYDSTVVIELERFTMPMEEGQTSDGRMQMSAVLNVRIGDSIVPLKARTKIATGASGPVFDPEWVPLPGSTMAVGLAEIARNNEDPTKSTGDLVFRDMSKPMPRPREVFTVDFSVKPWISLVWFGVITMVLGFAFSIVRYTRQVRKQSTLVVAEDTPLAGTDTESIKA